MDKPHPAKEYLFKHIGKSEKKYKKLISEEKYSTVINDIVSTCYSDIASENKHENLRVLATGILHYLLTNSTIPSQRKIKPEGMELDIVIPDLKTLKNDPKKSLIILIPENNDKISIEKKIKNLHALQPYNDNIWLVLTKDIPIKNKSFVISNNNTSFTQIIYEIAQFANINCQNKFKILRI